MGRQDSSALAAPADAVTGYDLALAAAIGESEKEDR